MEGRGLSPERWGGQGASKGLPFSTDIGEVGREINTFLELGLTRGLLKIPASYLERGRI